MKSNTKFFNRMNVQISCVLLALFAVIAIVVGFINQNNVRDTYEDYFTERVLLTNALMASILHSEEVSYYVELVRNQDDEFKQKQVQYYQGREEMSRLRSTGASEDEIRKLQNSLMEFRRELESLKDEKYWQIVDELRELKETSRSTYVYVLADTGIPSENGSNYYSFIFDANDSYADDDTITDGLGTCTVGEDSLDITFELKTQMERVQYYSGVYGELYYAYAPILDDDGNVIAVLGTDLELVQMKDMTTSTTILFNTVFIIFFTISILIIFTFLTVKVIKPLRSLTHTANELTWGNRDITVSETALRQRSEVGILAHALKEAIEENKKNISYLEYSLNNVAAMICVTDPETDELLFVNAEMRRVCGVPEHYSGLKCFSTLQNFDERCEFCPCRELDLDPDREVIWEQKHEGLARIYRSYSRYIKWPGGKTVHLQYSADITDMIEAQKEIEIALRKAEAANEAKSTFLANMSHEIRTPMNAILGITEIELQKGMLPSDTEEALSKIYDSGDLLLGIINDILDFSKIEEGKLEIVPAEYSLPSLISESVQMNIIRYNNNLIKFVLDVDENIPLSLYGDKLRIKQVLNNILSNAFKYTDKGKITMSVRIEPGDTLIFCVSDTGRGMTEEQIGKLYEEYMRFNLYINRTIQGTGLGMSITKRLVDLMGGKITVESEINKGTTVTVYLPQKRVNEQICGYETAKQLNSLNFRSTAISKANRTVREKMLIGKVLIVDDMDTNIYVTKGMLAPYGLQIDTASSGFEAIEKIENGEVYDIIFMDYMMPRMNGMEATKYIRTMGYKNAIAALTANALKGQAELFLQNGFDAFISKPIDSRELKAVLNRFIPDKDAVDITDDITEPTRRKSSRTPDKKQPDHKKLTELEEFFIMDAHNAVMTLDGLSLAFDAMSDAELNDYKITVHGMKSALANIGEKTLSKEALALEKAAADKNYAFISSKTAVFIAKLKALVEKIEHNEQRESES